MSNGDIVASIELNNQIEAVQIELGKLHLLLKDARCLPKSELEKLGRRIESLHVELDNDMSVIKGALWLEINKEEVKENGNRNHGD